jgi:hypothetical protein
MQTIMLVAVLTMLSFINSANAQQAAAPPPPPEVASETTGRLPVKRVVLYKNGVGYFEHSTRVHGTQDLNIDFTSGKLLSVETVKRCGDVSDGRTSPLPEMKARI